jgi:large subunit ribosomal protein L27
MAHKKGLGSSRNGRDSNPQYLGVKLFAGQVVTGGEIIVRQRGTRFNPGPGTGIGRDDTIYAKAPGTIQFSTGRKGKRWISIEPAGDGDSATAQADAPTAA